MIGTVATFACVEEMLPETVSTPVGVTVGAAVPPLLLNTIPASVLLPTSVSVAPPFSVTTLLG